MRRFIATLSLAIGLTASAVLAVNAAARPFDPSPGAPGVPSNPAACPNTSGITIVPAGVYRAMVEELRQQGYTRAEIQAELGQARIVPANGTRSSGTKACSTAP